MESHCISYSDTGAFSPAVTSYLAGAADLSSFYAFPPSAQGLKQRLESKRNDTDRSLLAKVLEEQYSGSSLHPAVAGNLSALLDENTFTVTTGHQLNIFTGPLYFIYKIVTAINLAREMEAAAPGRHFVPVYWMASEDHDFAEINHLTVSGRTLNWEQSQQGATGKIPTASLSATLQEYISLLNGPFAPDLAQKMEASYKEGRNLADATRILVNSLFEQYGLLIIDADDRRLKQRFSGIVSRDILEQNSHREILETSSKLQQAGYPTQVNAREINFFYLNEGSRERITLEDGRYYVLNSRISFSKEELQAEIDDHPERFSPNVMMRPLYQEIILPNIAYIGGGAELVYWLQLKGIFDFYQVDYPVLVLRNSALLVEKGLAAELQRHGFSYTDLFTAPDELSKRYTLATSTNNLNLSSETSRIATVFDELGSRLAAIDATLVPSAAAVHARLGRALVSLEKKLLKAEKRKFEKDLAPFFRLREAAFPGGALQERTENFGPFFARYGSSFIDELAREFHPLDFQFTILVEK